MVPAIPRGKKDLHWTRAAIAFCGHIPGNSEALTQSPRGLLTQWLCPVNSLDVHEAWQVGPHQDDIATGILVGPVDATSLPVGPVDIGVKQSEAIWVLYW